MVTTAGRGTNRGTRPQTRLRGGVPSCVLLRPSSGKCGGEEGKTGTVAHIDLRVSVGRACEGWGGRTGGTAGRGDTARWGLRVGGFGRERGGRGGGVGLAQVRWRCRVGLAR